MINTGRHPCNYDRLDFTEHETGDVGQEGIVTCSATVLVRQRFSAFLFSPSVFSLACSPTMVIGAGRSQKSPADLLNTEKKTQGESAVQLH